MRKVMVIAALLVVAAFIATPLLNGLSQGNTPPAQTGQRGAAGIRTVAIDRGDLKLTVSATGNVVPALQSNVSFDQPGRVVEVLVQQDQRVDAGQTLARQDDATQKATLQQAESNFEASQAALQKLLRPVDPNEIAKQEANVKAAQAAYSAASTSVGMDQIHTAELQYQQAQSAAQAAEQMRIEAGGRYSQNDPNYQKALAQVGQASFNAEVARLKLEQMKRGPNLAQATANIAYQQALLAQLKAGPRQTDIDAAQANLEIAKLQRDQAQHDLDRTQIKAPFAGIVSTINVKAGEVSSGTAVVVTDTSTLYIDVNVDETDIGKIRVSEPVQFTLDALANTTVNGKAQRIAQTADTSASVITYVVRVALDQPNPALKVGMTANAVFLVEQRQNVVRIPNEYLRQDRTTNQTTVNRVNPDGSISQIPVKVGLQGADYTEVLSGLNEGDTVALITAGAAGANPGGNNGGGGNPAGNNVGGNNPGGSNSGDNGQ